MVLAASHAEKRGHDLERRNQHSRIEEDEAAAALMKEGVADDNEIIIGMIFQVFHL